MRKYGSLSTVIVLLAVGLAACSDHGSLPRGDSIRAITLGGATHFTKAKVGGQYGVAFPILINKTDAPITIEHIRLTHVPNGVRVIGYRALKARGPADIYASYEGTGAPEDYLRYPNLFRPGRTKLPPHSTGHIFFAADLRWVKFTRDLISGCEVTYMTQDGKMAQQTFECYYRMTDVP